MVFIEEHMATEGLLIIGIYSGFLGSMFKLPGIRSLKLLTLTLKYCICIMMRKGKVGKIYPKEFFSCEGNIGRLDFLCCTGS